MSYDSNSQMSYSSGSSGNSGRPLSTLHLIWGIINVVCCCMPCGIAAIVLTVLAKDAPDDFAAQKRLTIAMILNIIGTAGAVLIYVVYFLLFFIGGFSDFMYYI